MACGFHNKGNDDKNVLIFDFGGGTFDTTVVYASEGSLEVCSTNGDMRLGGLDLDQVVMKMCEKKIWRELTLQNGG